MRYVCYKTVVSRVIDEVIHDIEIVKSIIESFCEKELSCAIQVGNDPKHSFCRILSAGEDTFRYVVYTRDATLKRSARYKDVGYLELKTEDSVIASMKPHPNRWILLDADVGIDDEV